MYWLEASDVQGSTWNSTFIATLPATGHGNAQGYTIAQIVPGGKPEILLSSGDGIHYLEIPSNPAAGSWPKTQINRPGSEEAIGAADIDRDGRVDVAAAIQKGTARIAWWKNPGNGSAFWPQFEIGSLPSRYADRLYAADLNNDSRLDIVVSAANGSSNGVYWFEQPTYLQSSNWTRHSIGQTGSANSMDVGDLDRDGDIDVVVGEHQGSLRVLIFENQNDASSWTQHVADTGKESHLGTRLNDLDDDGDFDITSIGWTNNKFLHVWRNDAVTSMISKCSGLMN